MIFLEYYSKGESHSEANAASIAIMLQKYPKDIIHLFCTQGHYQCLKNILNNAKIPFENILFHEIEAFPEKYEYSRFVIDFKLIKSIFDFAKKNHETKIFSTYTTTMFLYYLKLFLIFNPEISAITTIHSELERLYILKYSNGFDGIRKYFTILYCILFGLYIPLSINLKNYKSLVYGESIKRNLLKKIVFLKEESVIAIDHPYIINDIKQNKELNNEKINFGLIGLIDKKKNGKNLLQLLNQLKDKYSNNFKISLIGHIRNKITEEYLNKYLSLDFVERASQDTEFISKELRDELELQVDYNIYTYNTDGYKLTASGAFMDAVSFEKPIIAIKNDFFEYYFNRFGNIGYLCNTIDEMVEQMLKIIKDKPNEEYNLQKENLKRIKNVIDINYIAKNNNIKFDTKYGEI